MVTPTRILLAVFWLVWFYPYAFRAPHVQKRESITVSAPTFAGLFLEVISVLVALWLHMPPEPGPGAARVAGACLCGGIAALLSFTSVTHLGRQFRLRAGLYVDHKLVRTGPYAVVRHPIYASVLAMLLCTMLMVTPWRWMPVSIALFVVGTEMRVLSEERLLASRFGPEFLKYRRRVPAYVPWVR